MYLFCSSLKLVFCLEVLFNKMYLLLKMKDLCVVFGCDNRLSHEYWSILTFLIPFTMLCDDILYKMIFRMSTVCMYVCSYVY